jgi:hypothetical protein
MKGLFLDNFYKTIDGMKMLLFTLFLIGAIIIGFVENQLIVQAYIFIIFSSISLFSLASIRKDGDTRWNKYEITLPVKRKTIIKCKYLSFIFWIFIALIMAAVFTVIVVIMKGDKYFDFGMRDILTLFYIAIALVIQMSSFYFVGLYSLGFEKSDIMVILSLIIAIGFTVLSVGILNVANVGIETGRTILLVASIFLFGLSYNITNLLYSKSEF